MLDIMGESLQPGGHLLFGLHQYAEQVCTDVAVAVVEERSGQSQITHTPCATNSMHILLYVTGEVKVDNMLHVGNVQAPSSHLWRQEKRKQCRIYECSVQYVQVKKRVLFKAHMTYVHYIISILYYTLTAVATRMGALPLLNKPSAVSR